MINLSIRAAMPGWIKPMAQPEPYYTQPFGLAAQALLPALMNENTFSIIIS